MSRFVMAMLLLMVATALIVWFVPGADQWVEALVQQILGRAAR
ncbi:MAG: hypothetical protein AAF513_04440 [Pseudomonadota bacterium]